MILVFYLFCIQSSPFFLFVCCKKGKIQRQESQRYRLNLRSLLLLEGYFRVMKPFDSILPSAVASPWPEMQTVRLSVWRNHPLSHECPLLWWVLESYEIELLLSGKILRTGFPVQQFHICASRGFLTLMALAAIHVEKTARGAH